MRTTIDIDEDVLSAAKELAEKKKTTAGKVISALARDALLGKADAGGSDYRGGFHLLPRTGRVITPEMVDRWLEEGE
jgi:hypothetical protein